MTILHRFEFFKHEISKISKKKKFKKILKNYKNTKKITIKNKTKTLFLNINKKYTKIQIHTMHKFKFFKANN